MLTTHYHASACATALLLCLLFECVDARVLTVRQNGTGDFTSVGDALDNSIEADTILVSSGTYFETFRDVTHSVALLSTDGASATVIDGAGVHRFFRFMVGHEVEIRGFTFRNAHIGETEAGALVVGARGSIKKCVFENGDSEHGAGAVYFSQTPQMLVEKCVFRNNTSETIAGACAVVVNANVTFRDCTFEGNSSGTWAGALWVGETGTANVEGCFFTNNSSFVGSSIYSYRAAGSIVGNTFHRNVGTMGGRGSVYLHQSAGTTFRRNIVSSEVNGYGLTLHDSNSPHTCNILFDNDEGPFSLFSTEGTLDPTETTADPAYCNPTEGDFSVSSIGPAAPSNSACGELIGAFPVGCQVEPMPDPNRPTIISIVDVPHDEGGRVRIKWRRSRQDAASGNTTITGYGIYRFEEPVKLNESAPSTQTTRPDGVAVDQWDYLMTVPARGDDVYQTVVETLCDTWHPAGGRVTRTCGTAFFVSAETPDPLVFFDSAPDTGFSIDNTPPDRPLALQVEFQRGIGNRLMWQASPSEDVTLYRVYRGVGGDFDTDAEHMLGEVAQTAWMDDGAGRGAHYKITALDESGNESEPAATGVVAPAPTSYSLAQNIPNPFNPMTTIRYVVALDGGHVNLEIYDVSGRFVKRLVGQLQSAGEKTVVWDGTNARGERMAPGIYLYRLRSGDFESSRKLTLVE